VITRKQIKQLDAKLAACTIPKDLKAIADAIGRLSEIERQLSGRPMPGTLRPARPGSIAFRTFTDPQPEPLPDPVAPDPLPMTIQPEQSS
jgi:hypothetical protein